MPKSYRKKKHKREEGSNALARGLGLIFGGLGSAANIAHNFGIFSPWAPLGIARVQPSDGRPSFATVIRGFPVGDEFRPEYEAILQEFSNSAEVHPTMAPYYASAAMRANKLYGPGNFKLEPNLLETAYMRSLNEAAKNPDINLSKLPKNLAADLGPTTHSLLYYAGPLSSLALSTLIPLVKNPWYRYGLGALGLATNAYPLAQEVFYSYDPATDDLVRGERILPMALSSILPLGTAAVTHILEKATSNDYDDEDEYEE